MCSPRRLASPQWHLMTCPLHAYAHHGAASLPNGHRCFVSPHRAARSRARRSGLRWCPTTRCASASRSTRSSWIGHSSASHRPSRPAQRSSSRAHAPRSRGCNGSSPASLRGSPTKARALARTRRAAAPAGRGEQAAATVPCPRHCTCLTSRPPAARRSRSACGASRPRRRLLRGIRPPAATRARRFASGAAPEAWRGACMYHSRSPSARRARKQVNALRCCAFTLVRGWAAGQSRARAVAHSLLRSRGSRLSVSGHTLCADRPHCMSTVEIGFLPCAVRTEVQGVGVPRIAPNWTGANDARSRKMRPAPARHGKASGMMAIGDGNTNTCQPY